MEKYNVNDIKADSDFFKALGHPIRLWIVKQLADKERSELLSKIKGTI